MGKRGPKRKYTRTTLQTEVNKYFESSRSIKVDKKGVPVLDENGIPVTVWEKPVTISGLAVYLGITKQTLLNYKKDDKLVDILDFAWTQCENYAEEQLFGSKPVGSIFNLKNNYGWKDQQDYKHQGEVTVIKANFAGKNKGDKNSSEVETESSEATG